jgi:hypothetical protein
MKCIVQDRKPKERVSKLSSRFKESPTLNNYLSCVLQSVSKESARRGEELLTPKSQLKENIEPKYYSSTAKNQEGYLSPEIIRCN